MNIRYESVSGVLNYTKGQNMFLLSIPFLIEELHIRFPELKEIQIEKHYPYMLDVSLKTAPAVSKWKYSVGAGEGVPPVLGEGFVNESGMFFPNGDAKMAFFIEETVQREKVPEFSEVVIAPERLHDILWAKSELQGITGQEIISAQYLRRAQEVHFMAKNGTIFWLFMNAPLTDQLEKLKRVLLEVNIFAKKVEYIDLRISGKLIYKPS